MVQDTSSIKAYRGLDYDPYPSAVRAHAQRNGDTEFCGQVQQAVIIINLMEFSSTFICLLGANSGTSASGATCMAA